MQKKFLSTLKRNQLCSKSDKILLAVSGGVDSMVMAHLFLEAGFEIGIATCDHQLRGEESQADKQFVIQYFENKIETKNIYHTDLEVKEYINKTKSNLQEAARKLRYEFLFETALKGNYNIIATAHILNDNVETTLFNLANKSGIRGLSGIKKSKEINENLSLIRPLLFATKDDIRAFAKLKNIEFREDSSNSSDKYSRNFIRHQIVPKFEEINQNFLKNVSASIDILEETQTLFEVFIQKIKNEVFSKNQNVYSIDYQKLKSYPSKTTILFEIINVFGFNSAQCEEIIHALELCHSGKKWFSPNYELITDRTNILFRNKKTFNTEESLFQFNIDNEKAIIETPFGIIEYEYLEKPLNFYPNEPNTIYINVTKSAQTITLRRWQQGDSFLPLGLGGKKKKVQDFFTDLKLNLFQKEETLILEHANQIAWIVGHRIDHRFQITPTSDTILKISFIPNK